MICKDGYLVTNPYLFYELDNCKEIIPSATFLYRSGLSFRLPGECNSTADSIEAAPRIRAARGEI